VSRPWLLLLAAIVLVTGCAATETDPVAGWVERTAVPLRTFDPAAPLDDLDALAPAVGDAEIVGLGESNHGGAELLALKHRVLRLLVERLGFRTIAWEEDWTTGRQVDAYIRGGPGDPDALVAQLSPQWQFGEVADVLRWLRAFNAGRPDPVRFVGVDFYLTGAAGYDLVVDYVAAAAPDRLAALHADLDPLRPSTSDPYQHIQQITSVPDLGRYVARARRVQALVDALPHRPGDPAHAQAGHDAAQLVAFYEHYSLPMNQALRYREEHAAANLRWMHQQVGGQVAYWAAGPHTVNAPDLRITGPPEPELRFPSAGSFLRGWYGPRYRSIGFTYDHGELSLGPGQTVPMGPPAADWFEHPFGATGPDRFVLDLRAPATPPVRDWLDRPTRSRGLPDRDPTSFVDGGALGQWYDVLVHTRVVTPAHPAAAG
jgi:erythromycin esterase-like protein